MLRRSCVVMAMAVLGCRTAARPLVLPSSLAGWSLKDAQMRPPAAAPEQVRRVGTRGWIAATYRGPGTVNLQVYELTSSPGGLEMVQQWRPQPKTVVFYTERFFVVVSYDSPDRAQVTALITALQKLLGAGPPGSST